jgi:hypothetical protein
VNDPLNAVARSLWLGRNDGELFADKSIEQRRLARIGPSENTNETRAKWHRIGGFGYRASGVGFPT